MNWSVYLKWDDKHPDDHIGQCQIGNKKIGGGLHSSCGCHNPYDQWIADNCNYADAAIKYGQKHDDPDGYFVQRNGIYRNCTDWFMLNVFYAIKINIITQTNKSKTKE